MQKHPIVILLASLALITIACLGTSSAAQPQQNAGKLAAIYGADEMTERVALTGGK